MTDVTFSSELPVTLVDFMGTDLSIARAAWVSLKGERAQDEADEARVAGLINYLMQHRHGTPFEHTSLTFLVKAPIFVWREWHRHRVGFSYNEMSGRYSKLPPEFYVPPQGRLLLNTGTSARPVMAGADAGTFTSLTEVLEVSSRSTYRYYEELLEHGIAKEVARMVLPVNIFSACYVTCNARSVMHFLGLRTHDESATYVSYPQWEIEQCARQVEGQFAECFPLVHAAFIKNGRVAP